MHLSQSMFCPIPFFHSVEEVKAMRRKRSADEAHSGFPSTQDRDNVHLHHYSIFNNHPFCRDLVVLGAERADGLTGAPDLELVNLLELSGVLLAVVLLEVVLEGALGLCAVGDGGVEVVEDGLEGVLEALLPVEGAAAGGGRAGVVHVVHAVGADQGVQGLCGLLDGLVERLRGRVAALAENLVLGEEHAVDAAHQAAALAVQVRVDLLLEGGLVEVARPDGDAERDGLLLGLAGYVLVDGDGGVDAAALAEEGADGAAGALGGDEDDVDVGGNFDLGEVLEDRREAVGEVEGLSRSLVRMMVTIKMLIDDERTFPFSWGLIAGQVSDWAASDSRFMTMVDLPMASSMSNRFLPGTQPSASASFHEAPFFRTPTMTLRPLSRRLRPWPWPCEP